MIAWVVDNDILSKGACYEFLDPLIEAVGPRDKVGVLGQARFVLPKKLRKHPPPTGPEAAIRRLEASLARLQIVEPTADEIKLAAEFEFQAARLKVAFDAGESTLVAVMLTRRLDCFFTGDKRAIRALQTLVIAKVAGIAGMKHKVVCLEQGIRWMIQHGLISLRQTRSAVCMNKQTDTALSICFSCSSPELPDSEQGLSSYIEHLRNEAPEVLHVG